MLDQDAATFQAVRPRLFGIAYRVLHSVADADDVVQDTWMRWDGADRRSVRAPDAFLATAATRLAINVTQSARVRHEMSIGPWPSEPIDAGADPGAAAERAEALELAVDNLFEKLTAGERAAYVLREAFDYPYRQIAELLELSEVNARQLVTRARKHLAGERRSAVIPAERQRFLDAFAAAAHTGELSGLEELLAGAPLSLATVAA